MKKIFPLHLVLFLFIGYLSTAQNAELEDSLHHSVLPLTRVTSQGPAKVEIISNSFLQHPNNILCNSPYTQSVIVAKEEECKKFIWQHPTPNAIATIDFKITPEKKHRFKGIKGGLAIARDNTNNREQGKFTGLVYIRNDELEEWELLWEGAISGEQGRSGPNSYQGFEVDFNKAYIKSFYIRFSINSEGTNRADHAAWISPHLKVEKEE